jgi:hypothetical protein
MDFLAGRVWVFDVEVVVGFFDVVEADAPGLGVLFLFCSGGGPPGLFGVEFFDVDRLGFVVALYAGRIGMLVIPDFFGWSCFEKTDTEVCVLSVKKSLSSSFVAVGRN